MIRIDRKMAKYQDEIDKRVCKAMQEMSFLGLGSDLCLKASIRIEMECDVRIEFDLPKDFVFTDPYRCGD